MKTSIQLHQLTKVSLRLPPLPVRLAPPLPSPQPRLLHPPPQGLGVYLNRVIAAQVFGRQRRTEIPIALPHPRQHRGAKLFPVRPVGSSAAVAMLQRLGSSPSIPRPDPFRLPVAQLQQLARFHQP